MHINSILVVGAGQLGSRYLQGLRGVSWPLSIVVTDPARDSLKVAEQRWEEATPAAEHGTPMFVESLPEAVARSESGFDIVIVSTSAGPRRQIVTSISKLVPVRYWILEKLLAQSSGDVRAILEAIESPSKAFVNTPYRLMQGYSEFRHRLSPPVDVHLSGGKWGLASNAVHMIDTVEWLASDTMLNIEVIGEVDSWYESKRTNYVDMVGEMTVNFASGSRLVMKANATEEPLIMTVIDRLNNRWSINQTSGLVARGARKHPLRIPQEKQSAMTPRLVEELLSSGTCGLPTLEASARIHMPLLDVLLKHWNVSTGASDQHVPIT